MEIPDRRFLISSIAGESLPRLNHFLYGLALTPFRTDSEDKVAFAKFSRTNFLNESSKKSKLDNQ